MINISLETPLAHELLKSSHDFIQSAVKLANENDKDNWKFSMLHLTSAIELLLKSRLSEEHWSLIFSNPDKATIENLTAGNFISVDIDTAINRLKNIAKIEISKGDKKNINTLKITRNKIVHFHIDISENIIKSITAKCLNIYIEFYNNYITPNWDDYSSFGYELTQRLNEFKEFIEIRLKSLLPQLENLQRPKTNFFWECSECLQDASVIVGGNKIQCLFCGKLSDINDIAEFYSKDNIVHICPSCKTNSYVITSIGNNQKNYECLVCGYYEGTPLKWCDIDGNILPHTRSFQD